MNWKTRMKQKVPKSNYERGSPWRVKDVAEGRQFLQDVKVNYFTTVGGKRLDVKEATDEQVRQILKKLNVEIAPYYDESESQDAGQ